VSRNSRSTRILSLILVVAAAFYGGTRYQKHREDIKWFITGLKSRFVAPAPQPISVAAAPAPAFDPHDRRKIETSLLPLLVDTVAIPTPLGVHAGTGGGITVVDDTIIIVDVKGAFFSVAAKGDRIDRLALPPLPNHAEDYDQSARKPLQLGPFLVNSGFVVHDVDSRKEAAGIRLFVAYERYLADRDTTRLVVSTVLLGEKNLLPLGTWDDLYESEPVVVEWYSGIAGGGRMTVRGDDLYLTVGDYNQDDVFMASRLEAQNPDSDFGKILKIDLRTKTKSRVSMGHRNPQGLAITSKGTLYETEHGPRGGDELNVIVPGKNYGWPITTFGTHYTSYDWPNHSAEIPERDPRSGTPFEKPVFAWVPSIGVSNLIEVTHFHPAWNNDLLIGSLKAQSLFRLHRDDDGRVVYVEPIRLGQRLRDIAALPDGTLVLWTDDAKLMFLNVDRTKLATNEREAE
jgi:aldose sugar dehydrogenase